MIIHQRIVERHEFTDGSHRNIWWTWMEDGTVLEHESGILADGQIIVDEPHVIEYDWTGIHEMFGNTEVIRRV